MIVNNLRVQSDCKDFEGFLTKQVDPVAGKNHLSRRKNNQIIPKRIGGSLDHHQEDGGGGGLRLSENDVHLLGNVCGVSFLEQYIEWTRDSHVDPHIVQLDTLNSTGTALETIAFLMNRLDVD